MNKTQPLKFNMEKRYKSPINDFEIKSKGDSKNNIKIRAFKRVLHSEPPSPINHINVDRYKNYRRGQNKTKNKVKLIKFDRQLGQSFYVEKYHYNFKKSMKPLSSTGDFAIELENSFKLDRGNKTSTNFAKTRYKKRYNRSSHTSHLSSPEVPRFSTSSKIDEK
mmetsp:Transcript_27763/g.24557  ORF Transcript_27763/g.24557 Transcript_27763/m.24557 type:complete len:164 (-) Transcript_27763:103-594(-)